MRSIITILTILLAGCAQVERATDKDDKNILQNLRYIKDYQNNNCFAYIVVVGANGANQISLTYVPCKPE